MTVVLLGGAGFIGVSVADSLAAAGARPLVVDSERRLARAAARLAGTPTRAVAAGDRRGLAAALAGADAVVHLGWTSVPASSMAVIADDARDYAALADADWFATLAASDFAVGQPVPIFPRLELPEAEGEDAA